MALQYSLSTTQFGVPMTNVYMAVVGIQINPKTAAMTVEMGAFVSKDAFDAGGFPLWTDTVSIPTPTGALLADLQQLGTDFFTYAAALPQYTGSTVVP